MAFIEQMLTLGDVSGCGEEAPRPSWRSRPGSPRRNGRSKSGVSARRTTTRAPERTARAGARIRLAGDLGAPGVSARARNSCSVRSPRPGIAKLSVRRRGDAEGVSDLSLPHATTRATCRSASIDSEFDFYGRTLRGQPQQRERWKRGVAVNDALGERSASSTCRVFPARLQGEDGGAGREPARALRRASTVDLDDAGDQGARAGEARDVQYRRSATRTSGRTTRR